MNNPFSDVRLSLKQVDVSTQSEVERSVLTATLGAYGFAYTEDEVGRGTASLSKLFAGAKAEFDPSQVRRFAGDRTLPRTRYFSVLDGRGSDGRTLLREMSAYLTGSTYPGLVSLFDTDLINPVELFRILSSISERNDRALNLAVPSLLIDIRPLSADPVLADIYGKSSEYVVQIPYRLSDRTVANVLDLRKPEARAWLVAQFNGSFRLGEKDFPVVLAGNRLVDFEQLLPSLLDQWLGGGWTAGNMTGFFARQAGAGGLVYPSARSNPYVELSDNIVSDSYGWCFVAYEDAPEMKIKGVSSVASAWPTRIGWSPDNYQTFNELIPLTDVEITYVRSGTRAGSFAVHGLAEYNSAAFRLAQVTAVLNHLDPELGADVSRRLNTMALAAGRRTSNECRRCCVARCSETFNRSPI